MPPVLAEHVDEQLTGRVGDIRLQTELRRTGHEDQHLHHPDLVQAANRVRGDSERVQRGVTRQLTAGLEVDVATQSALAQQLALLVGQLTRHIGAGADVRWFTYFELLSTAGRSRPRAGAAPQPSRPTVSPAHVV